MTTTRIATLFGADEIVINNGLHTGRVLPLPNGTLVVSVPGFRVHSVADEDMGIRNVKATLDILRWGSN